MFRFFVIVCLVFLSFTGCSTKDKPVSGEQKEMQKVVEKTEQEIEDNYIKTTIDTLTDLQDSLSKLDGLPVSIHETNPSWKLDMNLLVDKMWITANENTLIEDTLNEELRGKYTDTIAANQQAIDQVQSIYHALEDARKTYDKVKYHEVHSLVTPTLELINITLNKLEIERNQ